MTTAHATPGSPDPVPELQAGDRLTRTEFERRYDAMPHLKKAELLDGVVYMPSPVTDERHGNPHFHLIGWLAQYEAATPGTRGGDNSTVRLDLDNEPQPDALLRIEPARDGQTRTVDGYVEGAPELVAEVAATSVSYDLHIKKHVYRRHGALEYLVWRVDDHTVDWFALENDEFVALEPDADGLLRSRAFPGLWLDPAALIAGDMRRVLDVARRGLDDPAHATFVTGLA